MATPTKKQQKKDKKASNAASDAIKIVKSLGATPVDRKTIQGWTIDEVNQLNLKLKPKMPDLKKAMDLVVRMDKSTRAFEAFTKKFELKILIDIKKNCTHLLDELDEDYSKHFSNFLIKECGKNRSTAFKDQKLINFFIEWGIEHVLDEEGAEQKIADVLFKARELMYKDYEIQKALIPKLLENKLSRDELAQYYKKERSKWTDFKAIKGRFRRNKDGRLNVEFKDPDLEDDIVWILTRLNRKKVDQIKELLK